MEATKSRKAIVSIYAIDPGPKLQGSKSILTIPYFITWLDLNRLGHNYYVLCFQAKMIINQLIKHIQEQFPMCNLKRSICKYPLKVLLCSEDSVYL